MEQLTDQRVIPQVGSNSLRFGFDNRRKHVRIYYPADCPDKHIPELFINCRGYKILDISASGIRFEIPSMSLSGDNFISGVVRFPDNKIIAVSGEVVRYMPDQIAIKLTKELPNIVIMSELSRLRELEINGVISNAGL